MTLREKTSALTSMTGVIPPRSTPRPQSRYGHRTRIEPAPRPASASPGTADSMPHSAAYRHRPGARAPPADARQRARAGKRGAAKNPTRPAAIPHRQPVVVPSRIPADTGTPGTRETCRQWPE